MDRLRELYEIVCEMNGANIQVLLEALDFLQEPVKEHSMREYFKWRARKNMYLQLDVFYGTYKHKNEEIYEKQRQEAIVKINQAKTLSESCKIAIKEAAEIKEGVNYINYNKVFLDAVQIAFMIKTTHNMMLAGASLTDIARYVPNSTMGDIYHLGKDYLGFEFNLTETEREEVDRYDQEERDKQTGTINMQEIFQLRNINGFPQKESKGNLWVLNDNRIHNTHETACIYANCRLAYPYYYGDKRKNPVYAQSFEEVLEEIMIAPHKVSIEGLEKAYSIQEWNLLTRLKEALNKLIQDSLG